jgi:hypothetical protein
MLWFLLIRNLDVIDDTSINLQHLTYVHFCLHRLLGSHRSQGTDIGDWEMG